MFASMKKKVLFGASLLAVLFVMYVVIVAPVTAAPGEAPKGGPDDLKLDVGIYEGINGEGNPINSDPSDDEVFHFKVYWTVKKSVAGTTHVISSVTQYVGLYDSSQQNMGYFDMPYGKPYKMTYCDGTEINIPGFGNFCFGTKIDEEGFYDIDHYMIPDGYCPQYPYGQNRAKDGTTTENQKFFKGSVCYELYPMFDGKFGYCGVSREDIDSGNVPTTPSFRRCYILIR